MPSDPNKITFFARTDSRGKNVSFGIKAKDRQRHVYVIGKTGMGKSTMLENMAIQDIRNGEGMAFIDPHGSAAEKLLNYVPDHRVNDVLYFAPFDTGHPVSFNIMEDVGPDKRHLVVSGLMSVFKKIWVDAWSARMEYILSNTLLALLEYPDSTLLSVNRMLADKEYRKKVVDNVTDPSVKSFWVDEFAKYTDRFAAEATPAIQNKIGQFTANPIIRNIIGQPKSSFDIRQMMDEKKILIMNLSKGLIGETNANLLGSMLTTRIYLAAMSRADLSPSDMEKSPNFYFYVDEFQSFANATFANILSEARKYHLNLTIAHQYIEQMEEEVRDAVFGNVGTIISFRVGPFDAETLETIFAPQFLATDIVNLGFAQIYLTLMIDGIGSPPFSATTLPPIDAPSVSCKDMVIASSRRQFSHLRAEVEEQIHKFHEPIIPVRHTPEREKRPVESSERPVPKMPVAPLTEQPKQEVKPLPHTPRSEPLAPKPEQREPEQPDRRQQTVAQPAPRAPQVPHQERREERKPRFERRDERREDRRPQNNAGERQDRPKDTHLDELRSVLKNIVKTETQSAQSDEKSAPSKEEKFKESRGELRSLLSDVLKQSHETEVPQPAAKPQASAPTPEPAPVTPEAETPIPAREEPASEPVVSQPVHNSVPVPEPKSEGITPRELERMMRVGGNDKPPL